MTKETPAVLLPCKKSRNEQALLEIQNDDRKGML